MKKQIFRNVLIASFALSGLFVAGNNVFANTNDNTEDGIADQCAAVYNVHYRISIIPPTISISCSTGGSTKCPLFIPFC